MTREQLEALFAWVDARIDDKLESAFQRNGLLEAIHEARTRDELVELLVDKDEE